MNESTRIFFHLNERICECINLLTFAICSENKFYLNSWLHTDLPFNNCMARFGSLPGPKTYTHGDSAKDATWRGKGVVELTR